MSNAPEVLFSDSQLLVCIKEAGLLSVPGRGEDKQDCLVNRLAEYFPTVKTVHRLDMATSGLMIYALNADSHRALSKQFEQRKVSKKYLAELYGAVEPSSGSVDLPLICDWPNRPRQKVCHEQGKSALTHFQIVERRPKTTLVELTPITGRSHQLRVHMQSLGYSIIGDEFYAEGEAFSMTDRLHLHASELKFNHPVSDEPLHFQSKPSFV